MSEKKEKKEPSYDIHKELHPIKDLESKFNEFLDYHGVVFDEVTGKHLSKQDIMQREMSDIMDKEMHEFKANLLGKETDAKEVNKHVLEIAKKTYAATKGVKDIKTLEKAYGPERFEQEAKQLVTQLFKTKNYESAIAKIMELDRPYEQSRENPLLQMLQFYSQNAHTSDLKGSSGKKLELNRLSHLKNYLGNLDFRNYEIREKGNLALGKAGYTGLKFHETAENEHVLESIEALANGKDINTKAEYLVGTRKRKNVAQLYSNNAAEDYSFNDKKAA